MVIAMGVFGYGEITNNLSIHESDREIFTADVNGLIPTKEDFKKMTPAVFGGTAIESLLGVRPNATIALMVGA